MKMRSGLCNFSEQVEDLGIFCEIERDISTELQKAFCRNEFELNPKPY